MCTDIGYFPNVSWRFSTTVQQDSKGIWELTFGSCPFMIIHSSQSGTVVEFHIDSMCSALYFKGMLILVTCTVAIHQRYNA